MSDLNFQDFSTVQSGLQQKPVTLASATVITPRTFLTRLTGSTQVETITPPVTGCHVLALVSVDGVVVIGTSGNVLVGYSTVQNRPIMLIYDPNQGKYYVNAVV
jgi:hypothetical protein